MTIAFMGGEMGAMTPSDSTVIESTTTSKFNSSFARCAMKANGSSAFADTIEVTPIADCWVHFDLSLDGGTTTSTKSRKVELLNSSGTAFVRLTSDWAVSGDATFSFEYWNGTAWVSTGTLTLHVTGIQTFDLHIVSNTASGSLKLYVAGNNRITSGTVDLSGFTGVAQLRQWGHSAGISSPNYLSQIVIADESTIGMRLFTVPVAGAGSTSDWTGAYTNIDEIAYSDGDFINSGTANQVSTFGVTNPSLTGYTVRAVAVAARANCGTGGPQNLQLALRSASANYFSASKALDAGYAAYENIWETDPATSAAWVNSAVLLLQPGVKSIT